MIIFNGLLKNFKINEKFLKFAIVKSQKLFFLAMKNYAKAYYKSLEEVFWPLRLEVLRNDKHF